VVNVDDMRRRARRRLPRMVFDFLEGGADDELTVRRNREAFAEITLEPRYLVDVQRRDLSTTVLGTPVRSPIMLAPTGLPRLAHAEGELAAARAAGRAGVLYGISTGSSYTIEEIARAASGPLWFQVYLWKDREVVAGLVERAKRAGYAALCLTIDVPIVGHRERDLRNGFSFPPRIALRDALDVALRPRWLYGVMRGEEMTYVNVRGMPGAEGSDLPILQHVNEHLLNPSTTWDELEWLRDLWTGPLVVKGVMTAGDARHAVDRGADAVVVSNHGGRQLDGLAASVSRLPEVVSAVGDRAEVLLDGGIRRGSDVVKALALGARACLIGRPYWYGLGAAGEAGVSRVLDILHAEMSDTMALIGRPTIADLDASAVRAPAAWTT
jgi:isopentenyl diphosphate isomerase/L-lactate dehydrogenase-like FMN-dependent dehydrogenase